MTKPKNKNKKSTKHGNPTSHSSSSTPKTSLQEVFSTSSSNDENQEIDNDLRDTTTEQSPQITSVGSQVVNPPNNLCDSTRNVETEDDYEIDYDEIDEEEVHDESHHLQPSSSSSEVSSVILEQESTKSSTANLSSNREKHFSTTNSSPSKQKTKTQVSPLPEGRSTQAAANLITTDQLHNNLSPPSRHELANKQSAVGTIDNTSSSQTSTDRHRSTASRAAITSSAQQPRHQTKKVVKTLPQVHNTTNTRVESESEEREWYAIRHSLLADTSMIRPEELDYIQECYESALNELRLVIRKKIQYLYDNPKRHHFNEPDGMVLMMATTPAEMEKLSIIEAAVLQYYNEMQDYPSREFLDPFIMEMIIERRRLEALDTHLILHPSARGRYHRALFRYEAKLSREYNDAFDSEGENFSGGDADEEVEIPQKASSKPTQKELAERMASQQRLIKAISTQNTSSTSQTVSTTEQSLPRIKKKSGGESFLREPSSSSSEHGSGSEDDPPIPSKVPKTRQQRAMQEAQRAAQLAVPIHRGSRPIGTTDWNAPRQTTLRTPIIPPREMHVTTHSTTTPWPTTTSQAPPSVMSAPTSGVSRLDSNQQQLIIMPNDPVESFILDLTALNRNLRLEDVVNLERSLAETRSKNRGGQWTFRNHMTVKTIQEIQLFFDLFSLPYEPDWDITQRPEDYFRLLRAVVSNTAGTGSDRSADTGIPLSQRIAAIPLEIDFRDIFNSLLTYNRKLITAAGDETASTETGKKIAIRDAFRKYNSSNDPRIVAFVSDVFNDCQPDSIHELTKRILLVAKGIREGIQKCERYKLLIDPLPIVRGETKPPYHQAVIGANPPRQSTTSTLPMPIPATSRPTPSQQSRQSALLTTSTSTPTPKGQPTECYRCNRFMTKEETVAHNSDGCPWKAHPCCNPDPIPWAQSYWGKCWAKANYNYLPIDRMVDADGNVTMMKRLVAQWPTSDKNPKKRKKTCKLNTLLHTTNDTSTPTQFITDLEPTIASTDYVIGNLCSLESTATTPVTVFFDTGAFHGNYISNKVAAWLVRHFKIKIDKCESTICGADRTWCVKSIGTINFTVTLKPELSSTMLFLPLTATILEAAFDLVIGRPLIKQHNLVLFFPSQFLVLNDTLRFNLAKLEATCGDSRYHPIGEKVSDQHLVLPTTPRDVVKPAGIQLNQSLLSLIRKKEELLTPTSEAEIYIKEPRDIADVLPSEPTVEVDELELIRIEGPPELRKQIKALCKRFRHIFSTTLREESSLVQPMELRVDLSKWLTPRNRRPYRVQSRDKEEIIRKLVNQLLALKLIRPSKATAWSQVLLVPKPDGSWRLCIDYRFLNEVCDGEHWPLPVIKDVITRLGRKKPKRFGKMDFTSGFWQARLKEICMKYTAFTTFMGLYEFTVVAMGLKGAPSFFQCAMANEVLGGDLLYTTCELYIDDVIVHGPDDDSFVANLATLFQRFSDMKILLHPKKCSFGMEGTEFVGHLIDGEGKRMSPDKIQKVLEFTRPETVKELRSFLGLVNYFRDHLHRHSEAVNPLHRLLKIACGDGKLNTKKGNQSKKPLPWSEEFSAAYDKVITAVANCPKLYFLEEDERIHPIFLQTDASEYGYGAYLCQKLYGTDERPIAFCSKTFSGAEFRWQVNEKEAFGVYHAIIYFEYLLRDKKFTLQTDHKNLTFISETCSQKVIRWKIAIMEFNFDCEHIKGIDNPVADYFSRLKPRTTEEVVMMCYSPTDPTIEQQRCIEMCHAMVWGPSLELGTLATCSNREYLARMALVEPTPTVIPEETFTAAETHQQVFINPNDNEPTNPKRKKRKNSNSVKITDPTTITFRPTINPTNTTIPTTIAMDIDNTIPTTTSTPPTSSNEPVNPYLHDATVAGEIAVRDIKKLYNDFKQVHGAYPGHHGVERTYTKLTQYLKSQNRPIWRGMRSDVKRFVQQCPCCQKMSQIKPVVAAKPFTLASYTPWEKINIDAMGPFPTTPEGYQHIIVIVDCFTRFVELLPAKSTGALDAKRAILSVVGRYGVPVTITTDGGSQFKNKTITDLITMLGIEHKMTVAYSKEENAMVERANKEVLRHLAAMIYETRITDDWIDFLPLIQRIINSTTHSSTGVAPAQLLFGSALQLDRGVFLPIQKLESDTVNDKDLSTWMDKMLAKQHKMIAIAEQMQRRQDKANYARRDKHEYTEFPVNSYVLVAYPHTRMGQRPPVKTMTPYRGPMRVVLFHDSTYIVQDLVTLKNEQVHVSLLKKFEYDPDLVDPAEVARHDTQEFIVEQILQHKGSFDHKKNLVFKVRWQGYTPENDTWEPWAHLRDNVQLHEYLRQNNLAKHIPK